MSSQLFCLGDSLTFGLGVPYNLRWTTLVKRQSGWETVNLGICGDTTGGMLSRLSAEVMPQLRAVHSTPPPVLFVMGGSNDAIYSLSIREAQANLGAIVHQVKSAGITPVVGIPPPIEPLSAAYHWGNFTDFSLCSKLLQDYGCWLFSFCHAFRVPFVDFRPIFFHPSHSIAATRFLDGVHPNPDSHQKMAAAVLDTLAVLSPHPPSWEDNP